MTGGTSPGDYATVGMICGRHDSYARGCCSARTSHVARRSYLQWHNRQVTSRRSFMLAVSAATVLGASNDPALLTLTAASDGVRRKTISPLELTKSCLQRIERLNPLLNAFITVTAESALTRARELEAEVRHGCWRGPLHGIPVALKDNIDTAGIRT